MSDDILDEVERAVRQLLAPIPRSGIPDRKFGYSEATDDARKAMLKVIAGLRAPTEPMRSRLLADYREAKSQGSGPGVSRSDLPVPQPAETAATEAKR